VLESALGQADDHRQGPIGIRHTSAVERRLAIDRWVIVEPSPVFAERARQAATAAIPLRVVEAFFEDVALTLAHEDGGGADVVLMSGLLNELPDPDRAILLAREVVSAAGALHVSVPNAGSLHRRLAMAMGMISSLHELSASNRLFAQYRVYDRETLREAVVKGGFSVAEEGGYLMNPFANEQMTSMASMLTPQIVSGLTRLGGELPELASEIFVNARPS
jgi:hypothetical protein